MKTIVIAAGYATRLYPLTENFPKPLLQVGDSTILDRLLDDIDAIPEVSEHIVVTNGKFAPVFDRWAASRTGLGPDAAAGETGENPSVGFGFGAAAGKTGENPSVGFGFGAAAGKTGENPSVGFGFGAAAGKSGENPSVGGGVAPEAGELPHERGQAPVEGEVKEGRTLVEGEVKEGRSPVEGEVKVERSLVEGTVKEGRKPVRVVSDGTFSNETRLGAVRDLILALEEFRIDEDVLVVAADNILEFSFKGFVEEFRRRGTSMIMCHYEPELRKLQRTGVIEVDGDMRVLQMQEKPEVPVSHWAVPPFYIYRREDLALVRGSVADGCGTDAPGSLARYLASRTPLHAWPMPGRRFDIGSLDTYEEACRRYAAR